MEPIDRYEEEFLFLKRARDGFPTALVANARFRPADDMALRMVCDVHQRLNDAYMAARRPAPEKWSRLEKVAAISTFSVMIVHPFEVLDDDAQGFRVNPLFALRCGFDRIGARFTDLHEATIERMVGWLAGLRVNSASRVLDVVYAARVDGHAPESEDGAFQLYAHDMIDIDMIVSFYDVLKRYTDRLRPLPTLVR